MRDLTALGSGTVLTIAVAGAAVAAAARGLRPASLLLPVSFLLAAGANLSLKAIFARGRPELPGDLTPTFTQSFPSGHAFLTAAVVLMILFVHARGASAAASRAAFALAILLILLVGLSRIALGVHWPSDVAAGWLLGIAWASATMLLMPRADGTSAELRRS